MEVLMLEDYYVKPSTIDRVRSSWLALKIESYLTWLQAHGYSRFVVYRRLPLLFHFAEFAQKKGCRDVSSCCGFYGVEGLASGATITNGGSKMEIPKRLWIGMVVLGA